MSDYTETTDHSRTRLNERGEVLGSTSRVIPSDRKNMRREALNARHAHEQGFVPLTVRYCVMKTGGRLFVDVQGEKRTLITVIPKKK